MTGAELYQTSNTQQTPHTSPPMASYGVCIVRILEKIDCFIMASYCTFYFEIPKWHKSGNLAHEGQEPTVVMTTAVDDSRVR